MMTKPTLWVVLCAVALAGVFSGCQSSKIAYGNSYYFKQTPKPVDKAIPFTEKTEVAKVPEQNELYVSTREKLGTVMNADAMMKQVRQQLQEVAAKSDNEFLKEKAHRVDKITSSIQEGNLSKKETRTKRRELRKELRELAKEYRHASPNEMNDIEGGLLVSILLLGGGLLFIIIGAVLGGSGGGILVLLGALALIGGLVALIIWAANN